MNPAGDAEICGLSRLENVKVAWIELEEGKMCRSLWRRFARAFTLI
jgi:hypothetical protein